jgi:hypothetical protein
VRNVGAPRTFELTVTDAHRFVSTVEPKELKLAAGETGTVLVGLTLPPGTAAGTGDDIVMIATSVAGPPTSNASVAHFSVNSSPASQDPR